MGWWNDETGGERAARLRGENQANEHARKQEARQEAWERSQHAAWDRANRAYQKAEYETDLAAFKKNPDTYDRKYSTPYDVEDMPGEPIFVNLGPSSPAAAPQSEGTPLILKIGIGVVLVFFILPALLRMAMPVIGAVLNTIWLILLSAAGLLTLVWIVLQLTAGEDPAKIRRAKMFNPIRIGTIAYQVIREHLAERRARNNVEK